MRHASPAAESSISTTPGSSRRTASYDRLLRRRDQHLVDRRLRAERRAGGEPVLRRARARSQRVELQERVADDLRGAVVVGHDLDEQLEPAVEVRDALPEARRALVREDAHRDGPPAVELAEHPVGGHDDVVEEHLGELAHAVDHLDGRDGDPGRVHVDEERGDAAVARLGRAGAGEQHAPVGVLRQARPHLLAVDDPLRRGRRDRRRERRGSCSDARSLPVPGSENPWHHISAPESSRGTTSAASSGGAKSMSVGASTSTSENRPGVGEVTRRPAPRRARCAASASRPRPPTRSGQPQRIQPASNRIAFTRCICAMCSSSVPGGCILRRQARRGARRARR